MSPTGKTIVSHTQVPRYSVINKLTIPHFLFAAIHEKIFIVFMVSAQVHMLIVLRLLKMADFGRERSEQRSYFFKRCLFYLSLLCTCGLLVFFVKHRVYCHDMGNIKYVHLFTTLRNQLYCLLINTAFSWFSFFEYWIAATNMGFHATIILDFPDEDIIVSSEWKCSQSKKIK